MATYAIYGSSHIRTYAHVVYTRACHRAYGDVVQKRGSVGCVVLSSRARYVISQVLGSEEPCSERSSDPVGPVSASVGPPSAAGPGAIAGM